MLLLLAALGVICTFTPHAQITRRYLFVVALADWGHVYAVGAGVGLAAVRDVRGWNGMMLGNVGVSMGLNALRWVVLLGGLGGIKDGGREAARGRVE